MEKNARASKKQQELLQFGDGFIKGHGYGPSYREIMRALGYKSVSTVAIHIDQLIVKGYLEKADHSARSLGVVTLRSETKPMKKNDTALIKKRFTDKIKELELPSENDKKQTLEEAAVILGLDLSKDIKV